MENAQLQPAGEEFCAGLFGKAADIGTHEGIAGDAEPHALLEGVAQVLPIGNVIAGPQGSIPLSAGKVGAGEQEGTLAVVVFFDAFVRGAGHLHAVDVVGFLVAGGMSVEMVTNVIGKSLGLDFKDRRFVHVVPYTADSLVGKKVFIEVAPPMAYLGIRIVRENGLGRPYGTDHQFAVGTFTEVVVFQSLLIYFIILIHFNARIDHDNGFKAFFLEITD